MKKYISLLAMLCCLFLVGCGKSSDPKETNSSQEAQVIKTQVFDIPLTNDQVQRQTVIYQGDAIQKLILQNPIPVTEEMLQSIAEVGQDETKRLILESMAQDTVYGQLSAVAGLSYDLQFTPNNELFLNITLDVPNLDSLALVKTEFFKGSGITDIKELKSEQYLKRLESYGATPVTDGTEKNSTDFFKLEK